MNTNIRLARDVDLPEVLRLYQYFNKETDLEISPKIAKEILFNMTYLENSRIYVMVSRIEDEIFTFRDIIVGAATLTLNHKLIHGGSIAGKIDELVIDENYRGQGLGKIFIDFLVENAKYIGCYKLMLECLPERLEFYKRSGFKEAFHGMRMDL